jgi:hypothetical protein
MWILPSIEKFKRPTAIGANVLIFSAVPNFGLALLFGEYKILRIALAVTYNSSNQAILNGNFFVAGVGIEINCNRATGKVETFQRGGMTLCGAVPRELCERGLKLC